MDPELSTVEEDRWLVDRNRGGWQFATERLLTTRLREAKAEAWDEAVEAVAWRLDNGEPSAAAALASIHQGNKYRRPTEPGGGTA